MTNRKQIEVRLHEELGMKASYEEIVQVRLLAAEMEENL